MPGEVTDPDTYCDTCHQQFHSDKAFNVHFRGVNHIQLALYKQQAHTAQVLQQTLFQQSLSNPPPVVVSLSRTITQDACVFQFVCVCVCYI